MAKPEWGTKRICQSCAARFYDFQRSPITCPACGTVFELEALQRTRRPRSAPRGAAAAAAVAEDAAPENDDDEDLEAVADEASEEASENGAYEDADELGEEGAVDVVRPDDEDENS